MSLSVGYMMSHTDIQDVCSVCGIACAAFDVIMIDPSSGELDEIVEVTYCRVCLSELDLPMVSSIEEAKSFWR